MSYAPTAFVVDLAKVKALYGCKDAKLLVKILKKTTDEVNDHNETFADDIAKGAPKVEVALAEIIDGKCTHKKHGFMYAYALELACEVLGKNLFQADFLNADWFDTFQDLLPKGPVKKLLTSANVTENRKPIIPIPVPNDFPGMGYFEPKQVSDILVALKSVKIDPDEEYGDFIGEDLVDGMKELRGWLTKALNKNVGLLMFTY